VAAGREAFTRSACSFSRITKNGGGDRNKKGCGRAAQRVRRPGPPPGGVGGGGACARAIAAARGSARALSSLQRAAPVCVAYPHQTSRTLGS